ncbi:MAG: alpha-L-fucosidase [Cyclobacteriaceae bacterium]|nr:alpha-L-fucosidase [Cyclobacteriaceae bacterium]
MKNFSILTMALVALLLSCSTPKQEAETPEPLTDAQRLQWWDEAKFGLFIHWGVYAVPAGIYQGKEIEGIGEWILLRAKIPVAEYKNYSSQFNPVNYNPEGWVKMAKDAGMKYIVITAKHHDGFALYDSKVTDWDVVDATPYGKDLLLPLAEACKREGIKLGFYYSQAQDWVHPGGAASGGHWDEAQHGDMDEYLDNIAVPQVKEILENYGGLDILWWDTPRDMTPERAEKFLPIIAEYPNLITNNRLGGGIKGDTETPEQSIPATGFPDRRWEVCMTMNDTWGYKSYDDNWKSTAELILKLSEIVSKGGNFLLNVGPTAQGDIPEESILRLKQIGEWINKHGEAIYGTQANPFAYLPWGRATIKEQKLYLHVVQWPEDGILKLPLTNKVTKVHVLNDENTKLEFLAGSENLEIVVPQNAPDDILSVLVVEFEGNLDVQPVPSQGKQVKASSHDPDTEVANLVDGDPLNSWKAASGEQQAWIEIDLGEELRIGNMTVAEPWRIWNKKHQEYILQYWKGNNWVELAKGKTTGSGYSRDFEAVTAQKFKLIITGPNGEVPVLNEFVLNRAL